ncbi:unnamed protein product [Clonostachys rosea f. rosea IK726]|uniref:Uncharacterized protein n=1 Tax=Clonostachys rosea f. rosea IK726 TaxID=1349383 RepID=A0ACA9TYK6_BIOOC|nr:unnamed protein product [Clonostachys rosea f. rosea IK726]
MGLVELPTELLWLILERLHCPADLHSAFCASLILLQAFLAAREHIIASVLARAILPAAQRLAIATTEAPVAPREEQLRELWNFLDGYFNDEKHDMPTIFPDSRLTLMNLMWLHPQVELLAELYYEEAKEHFIIFLTRQAGSQLLEPPPKFAELSKTEIARFQRAFYRFELYSQCFGVSAREKWVSSSPVQAHHEHFLGRLEPWEVEEMCCVHQFLMGRVSPILVRMQDEIIAMVLSHQVEPTGHEAARDSVIHTDDSLIHSETLLAPDDRASLSSSQRNQSQGQQSSQDISKDNVPDDDDDLCEYEGSGNASKRRAFLPHVLTNVDFNALRGVSPGDDEQSIPSPATSEEDGNHKDGRNSHGDLLSPNLGYELFKDGPGYPTIPFSDNRFWPLRRLGYVFWDSSRILEPSFLECLVDARDGNDRDFDLTKKPSAEEVLKGAMLPKRAMDEIRKKYGIWPWERE